jgi:hypothetical protein
VTIVGLVAAPVLAGPGTIAALIAMFTIGVEKVQEKPSAARATESCIGHDEHCKNQARRRGCIIGLLNLA